MQRRSKVANLYAEKLAFNCKFCDFPITNPSFYPGKKLMINRYCPHCHSLNTFPFLSQSDQKFLRAGFFSNPLYPLFPLLGNRLHAPIIVALLPFEILTNFMINLLYMPLGLIANNFNIAKANKAFYNGYVEKDPALVYLDMLRQKSAEGNSYCSLMLGKFYLNGNLVTKDQNIALDYFRACKDEQGDEIVQVVKKLLQEEKPQYDLVHELLNLVPENDQASYYLAYLAYFGYGVKPSFKLAKQYGAHAYSVNIKDSLDIYRKLELN